MKVSIIIPSFNYAAFLGETLDCLVMQSFQDWEAWIIDDGSTDETKELVSKYLKDNRFHYHYQENAGLSNARNTGISLSKGEYIQFLDADDLISKDKITLQLAALELHPEVDISYTDAKYFDSKKPLIHYPDLKMQGKKWMPILKGKEMEVLPELIKANFTVVSSPLLRRKAIKSHIKFLENVSNTEDWYFWLQCALQGSTFRFLDEKNAYTLIRVHSSSMSQDQRGMLYGALTLRNWLIHTIANSNLTENAKELVQTQNKQLKGELYKHLMLTGPLWNMSHLSFMSKYGSLKNLLRYHKQGRKHQKTLKNQL